MKRCFMKSGPAPINKFIGRVEYIFPDEGELCITRRAIGPDGNMSRSPCPWSFKDALSLVASGNWVEVAQNEQNGQWWAPSADELELIAKKRRGDPDEPATTVEMVW